MRWTPRKSLAAMALVGLLTLPHAADAGLGPIQVLSNTGEKFAALIPFVDELPGNAVTVSLADRDRYPLLTPYSPSADKLTFTLQRSLDGSPTGILVMGPANFSESELQFAVSMRWASGGEVREYLVDYRHEGPRRKPATPTHNDDKKSLAPSPLFPHFANLGLGGLKIKSMPGEPFVAESEVFGAARSPMRLRVQILPEAGLKNQPELMKLVASMRHTLVRAPSGATLLRLQSDLPVNAASFGFRLNVSLGSAHMLRGYQIDSHAGGFSVSEHTLSGRASAFKVLRVLPGDSLSEIAHRLKHGKLARRDVLERLYQENPQAFIAGDINKLVAGAQLKYPEAWARRSTSVTPSTPAAVAQIPAPAPRAPDASLAARQVKEAALQAHLREQEKLLAQAQQLSSALESKLRDLRSHPAAAAAAPVAKPSVPAVKTAPAAPVAKPSAPAVKTAAPAPVAKPSAPAVKTPAPAPVAKPSAPVVKTAPAAPVAKPSAHKPVGAASHAPFKPNVVESSAALIAAAAATALALRRRRLRLQAEGRDVVGAAPTVEGMRQWLRYDPKRDDLRYRLLQLLASQDDSKGFIAEAEQARLHFDEQGPMWRSVVEMGRELAPDYPWPSLPESDDSSLVSEAPATPPEPSPTSVATPPVETQPERPLILEHELDALAEDEVLFREPELVVENDPPQELDKSELAKLYLEMGDTAAANELMRTSKTG